MCASFPFPTLPPCRLLLLQNATMSIPDVSTVSKRHAMLIELKQPQLLRPGGQEGAGGAAAGAGSAEAAASSSSSSLAAALQPSKLIFCAENKDEQESWLQALSCAAVPDSWPGGVDQHGRPQPLHYVRWMDENKRRKQGLQLLAAAAAVGAAVEGAGSKTGAAAIAGGAGEGAGDGLVAGAAAAGTAATGGNSALAAAQAAAAIPVAPSPIDRLPLLKGERETGGGIVELSSIWCYCGAGIPIY